MRRISVFMAMAVAVLYAGPVLAQQPGFLENPADFSNESGIGVVSGFHCTAQVIAVQFDDRDLIEAASGTSRLDTEGYCGGHSDTGYALLWNWNILGDGQHTVRVFADGVEFVRTQGRVNIADEARDLIQAILDEYGAGILVTDVQLQNIDPPGNVLDAFRDAGGNFVDTADVYGPGTSEEVLGRWLAGRERDDLGSGLGAASARRSVSSRLALTLLPEAS